MKKNPGHTGGREPYVEHYPPLRDWLDKHGARCDWQRYEENANVEQWHMADGGRFVLVIMANGRGWDIYTPADTNAIDASLRDAEQRLGLREVPMSSSHEATAIERDIARAERDRARAALRAVLGAGPASVTHTALKDMTAEEARAALIAAREGGKE